MAERDPLVALWPRNAVREMEAPRVEMMRVATLGPPPLAGAPQSVSSPSGAWKITYVGVQAHRGSVHTIRALLARHRGHAAPIYVGPYDYLNGPVKRADAISPIFSMWDDGTIFSDGTRWETSIFDCTLSANASEGATQISITNSVTAPLQEGDYFELAGRLHILATLSGSTATIWPALRTSYSSGQKIEIEDPRMLAYLDLTADQALQLQYGHWGDLPFPFLEAPW